MGRPKKTWGQVLKEDMRVLNINEETAGDKPVEATQRLSNHTDLGKEGCKNDDDDDNDDEPHTGQIIRILSLWRNCLYTGDVNYIFATNLNSVCRLYGVTECHLVPVHLVYF